MGRILKTGSYISLLILITTCDPSQLEQPTQNITEASYFTKVDHFEDAIRGVYAALAPMYAYIYNQITIPHQIRLLPADDVTHSTSEYPDDKEVFETFYDIDGVNLPLNLLYMNMYALINRALIVLEKFEEVNVEEIYLDQPELRNYHKGEALFLRALMYYRIYCHWGGNAPILLNRITTINAINLEMSGGTRLLDQAIEDLIKAADLLPLQWDEKYRGRATANSAYGLLGKVYLFRACYNHNESDYSEALKVFDKLNNMTLMTDFGANFDPQQENNSESLFEYQASAPTDLFNNLWTLNQSQNLSAFWGFFNGIMLFSKYPYMPTEKLINAFHPDDPRFNEIFTDEPVLINGQITFSPTGYYFVKYLKRSPLEPVGPRPEYINNPRILRYADVLLLKAEALLKTGNPTEAIQAINEVRTRARNMVTGVDEPADFPESESSPQTIMQWIMDERMRELCAEESIRWFDLKRWHAAGDIDLSTWGPEEFSTVRDDFDFDVNKHLLWPLPQGDVLKNPKLEQNPGY
jgi:hypothetical protein